MKVAADIKVPTGVELCERGAVFEFGGAAIFRPKPDEDQVVIVNDYHCGGSTIAMTFNIADLKQVVAIIDAMSRK